MYMKTYPYVQYIPTWTTHNVLVIIWHVHIIYMYVLYVDRLSYHPIPHSNSHSKLPIPTGWNTALSVTVLFIYFFF